MGVNGIIIIVLIVAAITSVIIKEVDKNKNKKL
jgi:hypothetical protein